MFVFNYFVNSLIFYSFLNGYFARFVIFYYFMLFFIFVCNRFVIGLFLAYLRGLQSIEFNFCVY